MVIEFSKVQKLFQSISSAVPDQMDCDGCFELSAQFAEAEMNGEQLSDVLKAVQIHMSQCPCCAYEYQSLLEAVRAADSEN